MSDSSTSSSIEEVGSDAGWSRWSRSLSSAKRLGETSGEEAEENGGGEWEVVTYSSVLSSPS